MELPWHRARGKQRSMRDAPVSGSSLYDFRLRASSARRDPQPPQAASHGMFPALPTLCGARTAVVFEDDVRLLVLELTQAKQHDVSLRARQQRHNSWKSAAGPRAKHGNSVPPHHANPDALAQLPSDVAQSVDAIKAKGL